MLNRKFAKRRDQRGLTLAETLLVLAIGTVAIVGGTILYLQASGAQKVNQTVNNLNALQGQISQLFSSQSSYGNNIELTNSLIQAGVVPANMVVGAGNAATMQNAWGGVVEVHATGGGSGYRISYEDVPRDACVSLVTKLAGGSSQNALRGFGVDSTAPTGANPARTPPVDLATALTDCDEDVNNGMTFYYR
ncbi:MAG: type 4a pilus major pilin PilS [Alphaproteobacteria bacterium]